MMDHLSEPGHATIQHHLVTDMTRRRPTASQPSVNKTITYFIRVSPRYRGNLDCARMHLRVIEFQTEAEKEIARPCPKLRGLDESQGGRISREDKIMCQRNMLTAQAGKKWDTATSEVCGCAKSAQWLAENPQTSLRFVT